MTINPHELAEGIKAQVDRLVDSLGADSIDLLESVRNIPKWILLEKEGTATILLAMRMYLDGVIRTLYREKK